MPTIDGLSQDWDFESSPVARWERRRAVETFLRVAHRAPAWGQVKPVKPKKMWAVYFMYAPDGVISSTHRYSLSRLKDFGFPILTVCACSKAAHIPSELESYCDALLWKDLPGYDFSAYSLALRQIAKSSPGADVLFLNDSVFGPFTDPRVTLANSKWNLTGFTASNQLTSHIQSYAFFLRNVNPFTMVGLSPVFFPFFAISDRDAVIALQETRFARVAARSMSVGALWFADVKKVFDPTIVRSIELLDVGFPFLKRVLIGQAKSFVDQDLVLTRLEQYGHPI